MALSRITATHSIEKTACSLCHMGCGMELHIKDGRITEVKGIKEHPLNKGFLCPKGRAVVEHVHSPKRLTMPLLRQGSGWKEITWDEAMDLIVAHLKKVQSLGQSSKVAFTVGMPLLLSGTSTVAMLHRFAHAYGTPNCFSVESLCYRSQMLGYIATLGKFFVADYEYSNCIVVWASNPEQSSPPVGAAVARRKKAGAKLVVIDPRVTSMAKRADYHLQPRPGTDCALMLAMMNVIIDEGLYDREFVEKYTVGFADLTEHVKAYSPERVQEITSVPADKLKEVARLFAQTKHACILQGPNGTDSMAGGFQNNRGIAVLQAITGNIDVPGGFIQTPRLRTKVVEPAKKVSETPVGISEYPVFYGVLGRNFGEGQTMVLLDRLTNDDADKPVHSMIVCASNPLLTWPNSTKVRKALTGLDFLVVMDQFMTETAKLAHLVLPAGTFLETSEIADYYNLWSLPYVMTRKKILEYGQCRPVLEFLMDLGRRMGYDDEFPWQTGEELLKDILQPSGLTYEFLTEERPEGLRYGEQKYRKYEQEGFRTPTGKIEIYSRYLADMGYSPLPTYLESPETRISAPELAAEYPLVLTTGARNVFNIHSQLRDVPSLKHHVPEPMAEIHRLDAEKYHLQDGDIATVENRRGKIKLKVKVTEDILPGVIHIPHGWRDANVNLLTDNTSADPITGYPVLKGLLCRISV